MLSLPEDQHPTDGFDRMPDPLILLIFNNISDIKTLIRCRAVSKRFNSLVPQAEKLRLSVDRVISATEPDYDEDEPFLVTFLRSIFKSIHDLISPKPFLNPTRTQNSPTRILRGFERIRELEIELPSGDLRLEKGAVIRWKAEFGKSLKSCVILGFHGGGDGGGGLKMRVVWTISALIAASARHYMLREMVREHGEMERLVVRDRDGEGTVVMSRDGLREYRDGGGDANEEDVDDEDEDAQMDAAAAGDGGGRGVWWRNNRTTVPAVRMRMRHEAKMELCGGVRMEGATLVVVRPTNGDGGGEAAEESGDSELAIGAFGGVYREAVEKLLKSRCYLLEMNSF